MCRSRIAKAVPALWQKVYPARHFQRNARQLALGKIYYLLEHQRRALAFDPSAPILLQALRILELCGPRR
jgi:hypothetical protein